jgi:uncharacterized integral membrane protein
MRGILLLIVLILGLVALFTFQNATPVEVRFLGFAWTAQLLGVISASFTAGALAGFLAGIPGSMRKSRRLRELERAAADAAAKAAAPAPPAPPAIPNPTDPEPK